MVAKNKGPRFSYIRRIAALFVLLATLGMIAFRSKNIKEVNAPQHVQTDTVPNADISTLLYAIQLDKNTDTTKIVYKLNDKKIFASELKNIPSEKIDIIMTSEEKTADGKVKIVNIITKDKKAANFVITKDKRVDLYRRDEANPLYIIDGKEATKKDMDAINPNDIESVSVWKDATAIQKFGEKGINGVIDVRTKKLGKIKEDNPLNPPVPDTPRNADATKLFQALPDKGVDTTIVVRKTNDKLVIVADRVIVADNKDEAPRPVQSNPPLYIVDGKEVTDIKSIDPNTIESISVWKDAKAVQERFGDKGKNGVIDIKTKKAAKPALIP